MACQPISGKALTTATKLDVMTLTERQQLFLIDVNHYRIQTIKLSFNNF